MPALPLESEWDDAPDVLYHYCSASVFRSIIESNHIWLSNIFYMNDYMEHFWFRDRVVEAIDAKEKQSNPESENLSEYFSVLRERLTRREFEHVYCACFSKEGDSLSQWRAYADHGRGFAIGFTRDYFKRFSSDKIQLRHIIYNEEDQRRLAEDLLEYGEQLTIDDAQSAAAEVVSVDIWKAAANCKNPAFDVEREWRLINVPEVVDAGRVTLSNNISEISFHEANGVISPHFRLQLKPGGERRPIREIWFGPSCPHKADDRMLRFFLSNNGFDPSEIDFHSSTATHR